MKKSNRSFLQGLCLFSIFVALLVGGNLIAQTNRGARDYFAKPPVVSEVKSDGMTVSWDTYTEFNKTTHYQVQLNHTFYGSSTKFTSEKLVGLQPGGIYDVTVVTFQNGSAVGVSTASRILMAPASPEGVNAYDIGSASFGIIWRKVPSATEYRVYEYPNKLLATVSGDKNSAFIANGLITGNLMGVAVTAVNSTGESYLSSKIQFQLLPPPPEITIKNTDIGDTWFKVTWSKTENAENYFVVINGEEKAKLGSDTFEYLAEGFTEGNTVSVQMKVINSSGGSDLSESIIVQLLPAKPVLAVTAVSSFSCTLQWTAANGATYYKVYENQEWAIFNVPSSINNVTVTENVVEGNTATYTVIAVNGTGQSAPSDPVSVTFTNAPTIAVQPSYSIVLADSPKIPEKISSKLSGKPLVVVQFPQGLVGPELALEAQYLEALAAMPELKSINFLGILSSKIIWKKRNKPENIRWGSVSRNKDREINGELPLVMFYNSDGQLEDYVRISMFIISPSEIYKSLPESLESGKKMTSLYQEQTEKFESLHNPKK